MDYYDPDTTDHRIKTLLEKAQEKDNASKVLQVFNPQAPVAQKIADQRWIIANSAKKSTFF